jgi:hypothetical protein
MAKLRVDLFCSQPSRILAASLDAFGHIGPFVFLEDVAEQVLNFLFEEFCILIMVGISCIKDLMPINLVEEAL